MAVPFRTGHRLGDLRQAAIGLAVPDEALVQDDHPLELAVPFAGEQRPRSQLCPIPCCWGSRCGGLAVKRIGRPALWSTKDAQRFLVQAAERGLDAIGQDP